MREVDVLVVGASQAGIKSKIVCKFPQLELVT